MLGVILAAGLGRRLGPLAGGEGKAMLPVVGRPLVGWVVDLLERAGVDRLVVVARPGDDALRGWLAGGVPAGVRVSVATQPEPLGMGHALACAAPLLDAPFLLSACDNLVTPDHLAALCRRFARGDVAGALSVRPSSPDEIARSSAVVLDGERVVRIVEKPAASAAPSNLAGLPLYCLSPAILPHLAGLVPSPRGELELQPAIQALIDAGQPVVAVRTAWRWTVNTPEDLKTLPEW